MLSDGTGVAVPGMFLRRRRRIRKQTPNRVATTETATTEPTIKPVLLGEEPDCDDGPPMGEAVADDPVSIPSSKLLDILLEYERTQRNIRTNRLSCRE